MRGLDTAEMRAGELYQWTGLRRHLALALLCLVGFFNLFDRQVLAILLEPIKAEFSASDTAMGALTGSVFAFFYCAAAIPLGWLADRRPRGLVLASCVVLWSLMTSLGGFAGSFIQLALTRIGVAVGEAGATPIGTSIIADLYPLRHRAKAIALYAAVSSIGAGLAVMAGGWLGENYGWRMAMIVVGLPGLVLAMLLVWLLKDPPRGFSDPSHHGQSDAPFELTYVLGYLWGLRSYRWILLTPAFGLGTVFGTLTWGPTFMSRVHGLSPSEVGLLFGSVSTISLVLGQLSGGFLADWAGNRDFRGTMWVSATMSAAGIPFGLLFVFADNYLLAMVGFGLLSFCMAPVTICAASMAQTLVPPRMRAMSSTILMLFGTIVGIGLAPLFIGASNDYLSPWLGNEAIRYSLAIVVGFLALTAISALAATKWLRSDYDRLQQTGLGMV